MNELTQKAVELNGQLQAASPHFAPLALQTEQASAIGVLCVGFVLLAISATLLITGRKIHNAPFDTGSYLQLIAVVVVAFSGMLLLNPWNWISAIHPELGVTYDIMAKFLAP
jgi:hypothetical protein